MSESHSADPRQSVQRLVALWLQASRSEDAPGSPFVGDQELSTRSSVYRLKDGVCVSVEPKNASARATQPPSDVIGMRLVGWFEEARPDRLIANFRKHARGVLVGRIPSSVATYPVALTSPAVQFKTTKAKASTEPSSRATPSLDDTAPYADVHVRPTVRDLSSLE